VGLFFAVWLATMLRKLACEKDQITGV